MWSHNIHYHRYLLRRIPQQVDRALDVGCGLGLFSRKLAERSKTVDAVDVDGAVLSAASSLNSAANITYLKSDFLTVDLPRENYDVIVSIAALHHMNLEAALGKMKLLLRPSGKLLILGLYKEKEPLDYLYSVVSIPLNFVYMKWHQSSIESRTTVAPTRPARLPLKQIKEVADTILPGSCLRRHLFWRYSLIWQKP